MTALGSRGSLAYPALRATQIYIHALNRGPAGVRSPADRLFLLGREGTTGRAARRVTLHSSLSLDKTPIASALCRKIPKGQAGGCPAGSERPCYTDLLNFVTGFR
jgi:hypothetical protein